MLLHHVTELARGESLDMIAWLNGGRPLDREGRCMFIVGTGAEDLHALAQVAGSLADGSWTNGGMLLHHVAVHKRRKS